MNRWPFSAEEKESRDLPSPYLSSNTDRQVLVTGSYRHGEVKRNVNTQKEADFWETVGDFRERNAEAGSNGDGSFCFRTSKETSETLGEQMLSTLCAGMRLVKYKKNVITELWSIDKHRKGFAIEHRICTIAWKESLSVRIRSAGQTSIEDPQRRGYGVLVWIPYRSGGFFSVPDAYPRNHGRKKTCLSQEKHPAQKRFDVSTTRCRRKCGFGCH